MRSINIDNRRFQQLKRDIILLIKATGNTPPVHDPSSNVLDMLEGHAASTDKERMVPAEPNPRDLGLLRDKVKYVKPSTKAEKNMLHKDLADEDETNVYGLR